MTLNKNPWQHLGEPPLVGLTRLRYDPKILKVEACD